MLYPIGTRIKAIDANKIPVGSEGVITGHNPLGKPDWYAVDFPMHIASDGTTEWYAAHDWIEPITKYDGNQLSTWDEVLNDTGWQPGKVTA